MTDEESLFGDSAEEEEERLKPLQKLPEKGKTKVAEALKRIMSLKKSPKTEGEITDEHKDSISNSLNNLLAKKKPV